MCVSACVFTRPEDKDEGLFIVNSHYSRSCLGADKERGGGEQSFHTAE